MFGDSRTPLWRLESVGAKGEGRGVDWRGVELLCVEEKEEEEERRKERQLDMGSSGGGSGAIVDDTDFKLRGKEEEEEKPLFPLLPQKGAPICVG